MSSTKGTAFVILLTTSPPAILGLLHIVNLHLPRSLLMLVGLLWAWLVYRIAIPYFTSPLRHIPTPSSRDESFYLGFMGAINRQPRGHKIAEWIDSIPNSDLLYVRGLLQGFPAIILTSQEALQEALVTKSYDFEKIADDRRFLTKFLGRGLIVVEGAEHKYQRKHLQPSFSGKQINQLIPLFWSKACQLTDVLAKESCSSNNSDTTFIDKTVELDHYASRATLDIIGLACLGRDFDAIHNADDEIARHYTTILTPDGSNQLIKMLIVTFLPAFIVQNVPFFKGVRETARASLRLRQLCRELMQAKRCDPESNSIKNIDIISTLIRTGEFSDDQLVDQVMTFLAAGHETTSNALCWTMYLLATHADIQNKLRLELRHHFGETTPSDMSAADLDKLPYLGAVVSEQLRLWPVVPITGREAARDTFLSGHFIPKGTVIVMSPWSINRSKTHWGESAIEFRPERWLSSDGKTEIPFAGKSPYNNITFLHGPRGCIGQAFSRAELKCLVVAMILRFEVAMADPNEEIETGGMITIKPKIGLRLRLTELDD